MKPWRDGKKFMGKIKLGKWEFTEEELAQQLLDAAKRGKEAKLNEPRATRVIYDGDTSRLIIELTSRALLGIPVEKIQGLGNASPQIISQVELAPSGDSVHWEALDLDLSLPGLVAGVLGTKAWMIELGRKGGIVQSEAKATAARTNGLKGGRPVIAPTIGHLWIQASPRPDSFAFSQTNIARTSLSKASLSECKTRIRTVEGWFGHVSLPHADLSVRLLGGRAFIEQTMSAVHGFYERGNFVIGHGVEEAANSEELALAA
jgi:Protein of unknown function (DUF2442)